MDPSRGCRSICRSDRRRIATVLVAEAGLPVPSEALEASPVDTFEGGVGVAGLRHGDQEVVDAALASLSHEVLGEGQGGQREALTPPLDTYEPIITAP